jgi:hypothetical protein
MGLCFSSCYSCYPYRQSENKAPPVPDYLPNLAAPPAIITPPQNTAAKSRFVEPSPLAHPTTYYFQEGPGTIRYVLLKEPRGEKFLFYRPFEKAFVPCNDINLFLKTIYQSSNFRRGKSWTQWLVYNDEVEGSTHTTEGHCKGVLAWNTERISWLVHSVPKFPATFDGDTIASIHKNQLIYGQSFHYIEFAFKEDTLRQIRQQLAIMHAKIYLRNVMCNVNDEATTREPNTSDINVIRLTNEMYHVAKSPNYVIDIYSDYLAKKYDCVWFVESWIRGHHIERGKAVTSRVVDIEKLRMISNTENEVFDESQDHSKWATSNTDYYWVGDLNRMTTQFHRGGGGIVGKDAELAEALRSLIVATSIDLKLT